MQAKDLLERLVRVFAKHGLYHSSLNSLFLRYAGRFDCGSVYECTFSLLDKAKNVIDNFQFRVSINQWEGREWHKVRLHNTVVSSMENHSWQC